MQAIYCMVHGPTAGNVHNALYAILRGSAPHQDVHCLLATGSAKCNGVFVVACALFSIVVRASCEEEELVELECSVSPMPSPPPSLDSEEVSTVNKMAQVRVLGMVEVGRWEMA